MEETKGASPLKQNMITGSVMKNILVFSLPYLLSCSLGLMDARRDLIVFQKGNVSVPLKQQVSVHHLQTVQKSFRIFPVSRYFIASFF